MNTFTVSIQRIGGRTEKRPCNSLTDAEVEASVVVDRLELEGHTAEQVNTSTVCMYREDRKTYKISITKAR